VGFPDQSFHVWRRSPLKLFVQAFDGVSGNLNITPRGLDGFIEFE
jgi:hypothetical protein